MEKTDTICAAATAAGNAGVAVIRISGPEALHILKRVFAGKNAMFEPRKLYFGTLKDGSKDTVLSVYFPAPHSYTGEDVAEIHCHGGTVGVQLVLEALIRAGARPAEPGEFTKRAFLNGKMDLSSAEAVMDYIGAMSRAGADIASRQIRGELHEKITSLQDRLKDVIAQVEAGVEYPEEDLEQDIAAQVLPVMDALIQQTQELVLTFEQGKMVREGVRVAIVGRPNVGKSSLLNAIVGEERAIVTHIPGTTRDIVSEYYMLRSVPVVFMDTAGIRQTEDVVEGLGIERSRMALEQSAIVLFLLDASSPVTSEDRELFEFIRDKNVILVLNKTDMPQILHMRDIEKLFDTDARVEISAATGQGINALLDKIYEKASVKEELMEGIVITNSRHKYALESALRSLADAKQQMQGGRDLDCASIDLYGAWTAYGEITGQTVTEDIIDRIFEKFCLGK